MFFVLFKTFRGNVIPYFDNTSGNKSEIKIFDSLDEAKIIADKINGKVFDFNHDTEYFFTLGDKVAKAINEIDRIHKLIVKP